MKDTDFPWRLDPASGGASCALLVPAAGAFAVLVLFALLFRPSRVGDDMPEPALAGASQQ